MASLNFGRALTAALGLGLLLATACGGTATQANSASAPGVTATTIEIGINGTLTGASGAALKPVTDASQAWFDYVNSQGGINGRKLHVTLLDDGTQPPTAVANVKALEAKPAFVIFGGGGSAQSTAIFPILNTDKVPYLFPFANLTTLNSPLQKYVFSINPLYGQQDAAFIANSFKQYGAGSLYFIVQNIPGYDQLIADAKKQVESLGGTFSGSQTIIAGTPDYTPTVLKMAATKPNYVMILTSAPDEARIVNTMVTQHALPDKHIFGPNMNSQQFTSVLDPSLANANLISALSPVAPSGTPEASTCETAFKKASPQVPSQSFTLLGCAEAQVLTEALKKAGANPTRDGLVAVLEGFKGQRVTQVLPPLTFGPDNRYGLAAMFWLDLKAGNLVLAGQVNLS
jgi:branched-chain amino acid transport system substrate-binding protein